MKKQLLLLVCLLAAGSSAWAQYDFTAVSPSGHTLYYVFIDDSSAVTVTYPEASGGNNNTGYYTGYNKPTGDLVIPASVDCGGQVGVVPVLYIGEKAFSQCDSLTSVTLPNTLLGINREAFYDCDMLTTVNMPDSLRYIHHWAFGRCFNLTGPLVIPTNVSAIGSYAFAGTQITSLTMNDSIKTIWGGAFMNCFELSGSITLPDGLQYILGDAFSYCRKVLSIDVPATVSVIDYYDDYYYGYYFDAENAFYRVNNINYSGTAITDSWEWGAKTLNGHIEDGVVYRDASKTVVTGCDYRQTSFTLPSTVDSIGQSAFYDHVNLNQISLPEGLEKIGRWAFYHCSGLTQVDIPSTVLNIEDCAFLYTGVTDITLPASLTYLGTGVFYGCVNLDTLRMLGSVPPVYDRYVSWSDYVDSSLVDIPIVVPCNAGSAYRHAEGWSSCNNIIDPCGDEVVYYTVTVVSADPAMGTVSAGGEVEEGDSFTIRATANEGYHFTHWNDGDTNAERTVIVISDTTFTAYFEADGGTEGISDATGMNAKVYSANGQVVVENAEGNTVVLYDAVGRQLVTQHGEGSTVRFDVPATGTYLVKVGNAPARHIVVVK